MRCCGHHCLPCDTFEYAEVQIRVITKIHFQWTQLSNTVRAGKQKTICGCSTTKREKVGTPQLQKRNVVTKHNMKFIYAKHQTALEIEFFGNNFHNIFRKKFPQTLLLSAIGSIEKIVPFQTHTNIWARV